MWVYINTLFQKLFQVIDTLVCSMAHSVFAATVLADMVEALIRENVTSHALQIVMKHVVVPGETLCTTHSLHVSIRNPPGFRYSGLQHGTQCFCGNSFGRYTSKALIRENVTSYVLQIVMNYVVVPGETLCMTHGPHVSLVYFTFIDCLFLTQLDTMII